MTACLDTNVLVDVLDGRRQAVRRRYQVELDTGRQVVVPSLVAHELLFGALVSARPDFHAQEVRKLLSNHEIIDWSAGDAYAGARLRARLRLEGNSIGPFDTLAAGQALNRGWTLVTANTREFSRIEELTVEDWSRPAGEIA